VAALKQQLYLGSINAAEFSARIAPIRARHPWVFEFWNINWLYYAQFLLLLTAAILVTVSLLTKAPDPAVMRYTWYGATAAEKAATRASWGTRDVVLSALVIVATVAFYIAFW
jgi:solute:Na+ symporter, SSS family